MSKLGSFLVAENSPSSERPVQLRIFMDGKVAVPVYLTRDLQRRAMSQIDGVSKTDCAGLLCQ